MVYKVQLTHKSPSGVRKEIHHVNFIFHINENEFRILLLTKVFVCY